MAEIETLAASKTASSSSAPGAFPPPLFFVFSIVLFRGFVCVRFQPSLPFHHSKGNKKNLFFYLMG